MSFQACCGPRTIERGEPYQADLEPAIAHSCTTQLPSKHAGALQYCTTHHSEQVLHQQQCGCAGCSPLTAMCFWSLSYFKTVSDHTGLKFPFNPTNLPGWNNAEYHDIHHSPTGLQYNYAQPYFTFWDRVMGSYKNPLDGQALPGRKDD